jgi:hypothetical protein
VSTTKPDSALARAAYTIPEFCFRNHISRPKYHRLRDEGRGPVEMRIGLNTIRITADAEREWQRQMSEPQPDVETKAVERAVKAADAAVKSERHVSKKQRRDRTSKPKLRPSPKRRSLEEEPGGETAPAPVSAPREGAP